MSADITESGKGWIPAAKWDEHFTPDDNTVVFIAYETPSGKQTMGVSSMSDASLHGAKYLKLATVAWPEFPYEAEDLHKEAK